MPIKALRVELDIPYALEDICENSFSDLNNSRALLWLGALDSSARSTNSPLVVNSKKFTSKNLALLPFLNEGGKK